MWNSISSRNEDFVQKTETRDVIAGRCTLQEILKEVYQAERKNDMILVKYVWCKSCIQNMQRTLNKERANFKNG